MKIGIRNNHGKEIEKIAIKFFGIETLKPVIGMGWTFIMFQYGKLNGP